VRTPEDRVGRLGEGQRPNRAQSKARQGFTTRLAWIEDGKTTEQNNPSMKVATHGNRDRIGKDSHRRACINCRERAGWPVCSQRTNLKLSGTFEQIQATGLKKLNTRKREQRRPKLAATKTSRNQSKPERKTEEWNQIQADFPLRTRIRAGGQTAGTLELGEALGLCSDQKARRKTEQVKL
jgi:YD repeat-containing protein